MIIKCRSGKTCGVICRGFRRSTVIIPCGEWNSYSARVLCVTCLIGRFPIAKSMYATDFMNKSRWLYRWLRSGVERDRLTQAIPDLNGYMDLYTIYYLKWHCANLSVHYNIFRLIVIFRTELALLRRYNANCSLNLDKFQNRSISIFPRCDIGWKSTIESGRKSLGSKLKLYRTNTWIIYTSYWNQPSSGKTEHSAKFN